MKTDLRPHALVPHRKMLFLSFLCIAAMPFIIATGHHHTFTTRGMDKAVNIYEKIKAGKTPVFHPNASTHISGCLGDTSTSFAGRMDYVFHYLNKSDVPTGMLQEYGIDFLPPENFTGASLNDSNYINVDEWRMLYAGLYSYQINDTANLDSLGGINTALQPYNNPDTADALIVMFYYYNSFKSNAITSNLVKDSCDQLYDVPGRAQSPYQTDTLFAMAPVRQSLYTGANTFIIPSNLFYSNSGKTISEAWISTDSIGGNWQAVSMNTPFSLTMDNTGLQDIAVKMEFTDSTVLMAHSMVNLYANPDSAGDERKANIGSGEARYGSTSSQYPAGPFLKNPATGLYWDNTGRYFISTIPYLGVEDTGELTIQLSVHNTSGHLQKPLIILDGFDPYNTHYYTNETQGNLLRDLNNLNDATNQISLNDTLDNFDQYDLVYLRYKNSLDYIERNAYLAESLIHFVDSIKTTWNGVRQKNVIIGESMGGVIARYALRDMELKGENHDTRLFINHDGPQYGANVPAGFQLLVQHLAEFQLLSAGFHPNVHLYWHDINPAINTALNIFNSPAAKELLVQRCDLIFQNPTSYSIQSDNSAYTNFQNELNSMGYPQDCRNISISDGPCNGTQQFATGAQLVNGTNSSNDGINYFSQLGIAALGPALNVGVSPVSNAMLQSPVGWLVQIPLALFSFNTKLFTNFNVWSVNSNGSLLYQGEAYFQRWILGVIKVDNYLTKCDINSSSNMLLLDNAPGSTESIEDYTNDSSLNSYIPSKYKRFLNASLLQSNFCFVPTVSSLAIQNPWPHLDESICDSLDCLSAFDDYYVPSSNLLHISYTQPMSDWIQQRQDSSFSCIKICSINLQVSGENALCSSSVYSVSGAPAGSVISWSATPSGIVSLTPDSNQVTVTETGNGSVTLQATISNACTAGNNYADEAITAGVPVAADITVGSASGDGSTQDIPAYYNGQPYYISNSEYYFDFQSLDGHTIYGQPPNHLPSNPPYEAKGAEMLVDVSSGNPNSIYFSVSANNTCGLSAVQYFTVPLNEQEDYVISPNPASGTITIRGKDTTTSNENAQAVNSDARSYMSANTQPEISGYVIRQVKIFDVSGRLVKELEFSGYPSEVQVNVSEMAAGIYLVEITDGKHQETQKVAISR